jgi:hypothetical protein
MTGLRSANIAVQLNPSWRIVVAVPNRCRSWALERLDGDVWKFQTSASGEMLRRLVPAWCGPIDADAAAILAQLPRRPTPLERPRKRKPRSPTIAAAVQAGPAAPIADAVQEPPDRAEQAGGALALEEQGIYSKPQAMRRDQVDDGLAAYWKFHHGIDLRREPRP